jgi:hypothetical protein
MSPWVSRPPGKGKSAKLGAMAVTARGLNRATLARQLLLERERIGVVDAVRRIVALQAQEAASPYVALWNRVAGFDPAELDAAFAAHDVVKATLMRITLHAVAADDHPPLHHAMQTTLRAARLNDRRFAATGLSAADADAIVPELLEQVQVARTNAELDAWFEARFGAMPKPGPWWALRSVAPVVHAPTGGPWMFGPRPAYVAAPAGHPPHGPDVSVQHLVWRVLEGFGPATPKDISSFALLHMPIVRTALDDLGDRVVQLEGPGGVTLFDVPDGPRPDEDTPAPPRLMAMWDSTLLATADRSRLVPPEYRAHVIRRNGDVLPTVLVDGQVCGVWRPVDDGIEVSAFHDLADDEWAAIAAEARDLLTFLADRDPAVYRKFGRWWAALPTAEIRVLG